MTHCDLDGFWEKLTSMVNCFNVKTKNRGITRAQQLEAKRKREEKHYSLAFAVVFKERQP